MKDHIHTIPVLDALREPENCAFCVMRRKLEKDAVEFIMGPAYMEDDVRMETDKMGFCAAHTKKMYEEQNRLGLALMLHTHMRKLNRDFETAATGRIPVPRFGKQPDTAAGRLHGMLAAADETCYVCRMVEDRFARYMDTFFTLWSGDKEAAALAAAAPGYCLPHFTQLLAVSENKLSKHKREQFLAVVLPAQQRFMKQMEDDLDWFIQKFDYRNTNEPWKNAKDALPRAMGLLNGSEGSPT